MQNPLEFVLLICIDLNVGLYNFMIQQGMDGVRVRNTEYHNPYNKPIC